LTQFTKTKKLQDLCVGDRVLIPAEKPEAGETANKNFLAHSLILVALIEGVFECSLYFRIIGCESSISVPYILGGKTTFEIRNPPELFWIERTYENSCLPTVFENRVQAVVQRFSARQGSAVGLDANLPSSGACWNIRGGQTELR